MEKIRQCLHIKIHQLSVVDFPSFFCKVLTQIMKTYVTARNNSPLSNKQAPVDCFESATNSFLARECWKHFSWVTQRYVSQSGDAVLANNGWSERSRSFVFAPRQHFHSPGPTTLLDHLRGACVRVYELRASACSYFHVHERAPVLWQRRINPSRTPIYRNTSTELTHICVMCVILLLCVICGFPKTSRALEENALQPHLHNNEMGDAK